MKKFEIINILIVILFLTLGFIYKELTIALLWSKFHVNSIIGFQKFIESLSIEIKYDFNIWFFVIVPIIDISIFFIITIILILLFIIRINRHKY